MVQHIGGSFAPPLSDELLAKFQTIIAALPASALKDALEVLHNCCTQWWDLPESDTKGTPHKLQGVTVIPLADTIAKALWDHIPWKEELLSIQNMCDAIPIENKELRNCAFHLLWHAKELEMDREPITCDKLNIQ